MKITYQHFQTFDKPLTYNFEKVSKGDAYVISSNVDSSDYKSSMDMMKMSTQRHFNKRTKYIGSHIKISLSPEDVKHADKDFRAYVKETLKELNLDKNFYVAFRLVVWFPRSCSICKSNKVPC